MSGSKFFFGVLSALLLAAGCEMVGQPKKLTAGPQVAHCVFFTLHNNSIYAKQQLVRDAYAWLRSHEGVVYFAAGERAVQMQRPVNDMAFDVSVLIVFDSIAAYDAYQTSKKHLEFIQRNEANWKQVRVFDSLIQ
ncbi:MAG TPA: Dabb family protein [Anaerohalosphaeraceae bacterium]|nr:Dabb family protein [Anaerohalosphaeraceae bacterium]HPP56783.1 Dabb family protein [Anaerohalosphaeraceae bacterium]